jgi:threonine synthase
MRESNAFVCTACGKEYALDTCEWRCECGGLFDLKLWPRFDVDRIRLEDPSLWRYRAMLPLDPSWEPVTLGEGGTPLLPFNWDGKPLHFKLEFMSPSGSFKDRGAAVLVTALAGQGVGRVVEDSSGNAGASLAAYAARAGIECEVCVPASTPSPKRAQMADYGAQVIEIKGKRGYAALAAWAAAAHGAYYASHIYSPYFLAGTETLAFELWEQLGRQVPSAVVVPTGSGTLLLGLYRGFVRMREAGEVARLPQLFGVQAAACAPLQRAFVEGRTAPVAVVPEPTVATGVAIDKPVRGSQILAAIRVTKGSMVAVSEQEIEAAHSSLAHQGLYVERTAATAIAGLAHLDGVLPGEGPVVVPLTGHGLKTCDRDGTTAIQA